jgi:hypothetical protein
MAFNFDSPPLIQFVSIWRSGFTIRCSNERACSSDSVSSQTAQVSQPVCLSAQCQGLVDEARREGAISAVLQAEPEALIYLRDEGQINDPLSKNLVWRWSTRKNSCLQVRPILD